MPVLFKEQQIRWTLRLLRGQQMFAAVVIAYCIWQFLYSLNPYLSATLVFTATLSTLLIFTLAAAEKGLMVHKSYAWGMATLISLLSLATPLFPLAIMSLLELLNSDSKQSFRDYKTVYSDKNMAGSTKILLLLLACASMLGGGLFYQFQKNSMVFEVAFKKPRYRLPPNLSIKELFEWGGDCNYHGKTECSIAVFLTILQRRPGDIKALTNLAMAQSHFGQHAHAIKNFQTLIDKGEDTYDLYLMYGNSLRARDQIQPALLAYKKALDINPHVIDAAAKVALILIEEERYKEALSFINEYLEKNPDATRRLKSVRENLIAKIGEA